MSQKEENRLPLYSLEASYDDNPVDNVQVLSDPSSRSKPMNEHIINLKGDPKPIPAEAREELSPSEFDELIGRRALVEIKQVIGRLNEPNASLELKGYLLTEEAERYDFEEIVDGFEEYLAGLENIVGEAEVKFEISSQSLQPSQSPASNRWLQVTGYPAKDMQDEQCGANSAVKCTIRWMPEEQDHGNL